MGWPSPLPRCVNQAARPSAKRSGVRRKLASTWPSATGSVSSKSAELVKLRMQNWSSQSSGQARVSPRITTWTLNLWAYMPRSYLNILRPRGGGTRLVPRPNFHKGKDKGSIENPRKINSHDEGQRVRRCELMPIFVRWTNARTWTNQPQTNGDRPQQYFRNTIWRKENKTLHIQYVKEHNNENCAAEGDDQLLHGTVRFDLGSARALDGVG